MLSEFTISVFTREPSWAADTALKEFGKRVLAAPRANLLQFSRANSNPYSVMGNPEFEHFAFLFQHSSETYYDYTDGHWKWINNPGSDFENEFCVVTGEFDCYTDEEVKQLIEELGGDPENSVSSDSVMVVVG